MRYRQLGHSELEISIVGLGCNNFGTRTDAAEAARIVHAALDAGINFFDTADVYGAGLSEEALGKALKSRGDEVVVATKFGVPVSRNQKAFIPGTNDHGASSGYIMKAVENSLRRLDREAIDLYQMHWPDPTTPMEESLTALDTLVTQGKVRFIGCSNFSGWQIANADWISRSLGLNRFVSAQNRYNLIERGVEREVIPACAHFGLGFIPYFPLADGLLTGKYQRDAPAPAGSRLAEPTRAARYIKPENFDMIEALTQVASDCGVTLLELGIAGLASQPGVVSVIAGATSPSQVTENAHAALVTIGARED